jgi:Bifunctional DNA primase/polymerase, N-terminal
MSSEGCQLAINLSRNCGYAVFPCREDKTPACSHGLHDASKDPEVITRLWRRGPGPLIGVATGAPSGVSVFDCDHKHPSAHDFWKANGQRLLPTRCFQTHSGGLHLLYADPEGIVRCSQGGQNGLPFGCDTRGTGGYVIYWFATGLECRDHSPPAPWPEWLHEAMRKPEPLPQQTSIVAATNPDRALDGLLSTMAAAKEGNRNATLFWAACRCVEKGFATTALRAAAIQSGLDARSVDKTIASARNRRAA